MVQLSRIGGYLQYFATGPHLCNWQVASYLRIYLQICSVNSHRLEDLGIAGPCQCHAGCIPASAH